MLIKNNMVPIKPYKKDYKKHELILNDFLNNDKTSSYEFILNLHKTNLYTNYDYYKNLTPLTFAIIYKKINKDKDLLINMYKVKNIAIFGSFANETYRIDSDIDLLVVFDEYISYEEKHHNLEELKKYLYYIFNRMIDICDVNGLNLNELNCKMKNVKFIF